eukprot:TRINITY_DN925_c0_g1_i17.p1 TRINITY_DN925_c0_g1~~TRINITY_DN925_c0_g1_i17.p1  ORF type:complete len:641 (+),score=169.28 TRINITY_DN925_c0_g1_i17:128-2050(+)
MIGKSEVLHEDLSLILEAEKGAKAGLLRLALVPPADGPRQPCTFVCAIDISSSMTARTSAENESEKDNFSRLDLVKHSVNTIISMMNSDDQLCLVKFNGKATLNFPVTAMADKNKKLALEITENLQPDGCTNIWDALKLSMDQILNASSCRSTNNFILLFTDGKSNTNPPEGIMPAMQNYLKAVPKYYEQFTIHTFGYGYSLNSTLLTEIATAGAGIFDFIPDSTMIGTNFVNFLANALSTAVSNAEVTLNVPKGFKLDSVGMKMEENRFLSGPIQYGQTRNFVFELEFETLEEFKVAATVVYSGKSISKEICGFTSEKSKEANVEWLRCKYCDSLRAQLVLGFGTKLIDDFKKTVKQSAFRDDEKVLALIRDIESPKESEGQVTKALSKGDWYAKWGSHYLRSLLRANQLQQCHNFKDPSVQIYGGKLFKLMQDKADDTFCNLPAPKPSLKCYVAPVNQGYVAPDMHHYMRMGAGCFDGEGLVRLANGTTRKVKELKKDDDVVCVGGTAKVVTLVKTRTGGKIQMAEVGGVKLTPWHPVRVEGVWKFPCEIKAEVWEDCDVVYNLVLDKCHIVLINEQEVVTLGHGFKGNAVVEHAYFGTEKVLEDLKKFRGWTEGNVEIQHWNPIRDPVTHLVQGLIH